MRADFEGHGALTARRASNHGRFLIWFDRCSDRSSLKLSVQERRMRPLNRAATFSKLLYGIKPVMGCVEGPARHAMPQIGAIIRAVQGLIPSRNLFYEH